MRILTHIAMRWCEVRSERAFARYLRLKCRAEKYFRKLEGEGE